MVDEVAAKEGRLDILVNNFGSTDVKTDLDVVNGPSEDFFRIVNTNLKSVYLPSKAAVPLMAKNGGGSIINIGSVGGLYPDLSRTAYGVSKAAIHFLTKDIAVQYARQGVRCNAVLPGFTATDAALNNMSQAFLDLFLKNVPLNRPGRPEDIADAVAFLASDRAAFITGEILPVAGGFGPAHPAVQLLYERGGQGLISPPEGPSGPFLLPCFCIAARAVCRFRRRGPERNSPWAGTAHRRKSCMRTGVCLGAWRALSP